MAPTETINSPPMLPTTANVSAVATPFFSASRPTSIAAPASETDSSLNRSAFFAIALVPPTVAPRIPIPGTDSARNGPNCRADPPYSEIVLWGNVPSPLGRRRGLFQESTTAAGKQSRAFPWLGPSKADVFGFPPHRSIIMGAMADHGCRAEWAALTELCQRLAVPR